MLYLRQLLILASLFFATPAIALDPFSLWLLGKGADKALDLVLPDKPPEAAPESMGERVLGAGVFSGGAWETMFGRNAEAATVDSVRSAKRSIIVLAKGISSRPVAHALKEALARGVKVLVVSGGKGPDYTPFLYRAGVPVKLSGMAFTTEFMVIDGQSLQIGLPNRDALANILRIKGVPEMARVYAMEWKVFWNAARKPRG